jgi:hypothetical protein
MQQQNLGMSGVIVLNIVLNNILVFFKINYILFNFLKFYFTKLNIVIRTVNLNNIKIQHPNIVNDLSKEK